MSDMGLHRRSAPITEPLPGLQGDRQVQGEKGILAKGIGALQKMWLHLTGKAGGEHEKQLTNLREHVQVKFGDEGLLKLNETLQKKGWDGSSKLFSGSEISTALRGVGSEVMKSRIAQMAEDLQQQPLSEQLKNPALRSASFEYAQAKFAVGQVEFLDGMNQLEANKGTMTAQDFNKTVSELVTKHLDDRGSSFKIPEPGVEPEPDHNLNLAASVSGKAVRLNDEYLSLAKQGKTGEANAKMQELYQYLKDTIEPAADGVWRDDNHQKESASGVDFKDGPMATYKQTFTSVATEIVGREIPFQETVRAQRAGEFIRG